MPTASGNEGAAVTRSVDDTISWDMHVMLVVFLQDSTLDSHGRLRNTHQQGRDAHSAVDGVLSYRVVPGCCRRTRVTLT